MGGLGVRHDSGSHGWVVPEGPGDVVEATGEWLWGEVRVIPALVRRSPGEGHRRRAILWWSNVVRCRNDGHCHLTGEGPGFGFPKLKDGHGFLFSIEAGVEAVQAQGINAIHGIVVGVAIPVAAGPSGIPAEEGGSEGIVVAVAELDQVGEWVTVAGQGGCTSRVGKRWSVRICGHRFPPDSGTHGPSGCAALPDAVLVEQTNNAVPNVCRNNGGTRAIVKRNRITGNTKVAEFSRKQYWLWHASA